MQLELIVKSKTNAKQSFNADTPLRKQLRSSSQAPLQRFEACMWPSVSDVLRDILLHDRAQLFMSMVHCDTRLVSDSGCRHNAGELTFDGLVDYEDSTGGCASAAAAQ